MLKLKETGYSSKKPAEEESTNLAKLHEMKEITANCEVVE